MVNNKMVIFKDYAEIVLYNKFSMESRRVKVDIADVDIVVPHKWIYKAYSRAISTINGKYIEISRYITCANDNDCVF